MEVCRKIGAVLFLTLAAVCFTSGLASGQVITKGNFTLSNDAQWGKNTLPKGNYNFTMQETGLMGVMVTMTSANNESHEMQMMGLQRSADASLKGSESTVIIKHGKNGDRIQGIYVAGSGTQYMFPGSSKKQTTLAGNSNQDAEITMRIPVHRNNAK